MRRIGITGLRIVALGGAALCAAHAMAAGGAFKQVRGWSLYRNDANCSAYRTFDNGKALGFTYDAPGRSTRLTFTDASTSAAEARSLQDGDNSALDVLLRLPDGTVDHTLEDTVFTVTVDQDGSRTFSSRWLGPPRNRRLHGRRRNRPLRRRPRNRRLQLEGKLGRFARSREMREGVARVSGVRRQRGAFFAISNGLLHISDELSAASKQCPRCGCLLRL